MLSKKPTQKDIEAYMRLTGLEYEPAEREIIKRAKLKEIEDKESLLPEGSTTVNKKLGK